MLNAELISVVDVLKKKGIITKDTDIVASTGYSKSVVSSSLSGKSVASTNFLKKFDEVYGTSLYNSFLKNKFISKLDNDNPTSEVNETAESYLTKRMRKKLDDINNNGLIYVPVSAQAGYSQRVKDPVFVQDLERVFIPGLKFKGSKYRVFEVEGDSMMPTLNDGTQIITEQIDVSDIGNIPNYYIYVIVSEDMITIKRIFRKSDSQWILISDNEDFYEQQLFDIKHLKELWIVKRKIDWNMPPPKKFEIKL